MPEPDKPPPAGLAGRANGNRAVQRLLWPALLLLSCADDPARKQLAVTLVELTGLDHESIAVNPASIVALRTPREHNRVLTPGAACAVQTNDGKHIAVLETCEQVRQRIDAAE
jgi:hypothetical protein